MAKNPLGVGFKVKDLFFDRSAVMKKIDPKKRRFLSKFGAFVRTRSRSLLNKSGGKGNKSSLPGEPPRKHDGRLRRNVFFAFDRVRESVVIGPIVISGVVGKDAPEKLEEGGMITVRLNAKKKERKRVAAHPFMGPAFAAEKKNISTIWRSS